MAPPVKSPPPADIDLHQLIAAVLVAAILAAVSVPGPIEIIAGVWGPGVTGGVE